jgi:alpha-1,3-mannosyl-glycoprotein beta-1,2-N-acetylglucosaminyltransferase
MAGRSLGRPGNPAASIGRRTIEQKALRLLLVMAWVWIISSILMAVWYLAKHPPNSTLINKGSLQQKQQQQPLFSDADFNLYKKSESRTEKEKETVAGKYDTPLLIFTCNRANYLADTLHDIFEYLPRPCQIGCPIIISQDGNDEQVSQVIRDYQQKLQAEGIPLVHLQHHQALRGAAISANRAYQALAQHYGWALTKLFNGNIESSAFPLPKRVMILEEDLHIARDFFAYMQATAPLLDKDPTLFAVSAFNDNGHAVHDPKRLLRSDFFPGLGWMMTRTLWVEELQPKWPEAYWDDWLREPAQRKERQVIRPEVSRTYHFGTKGGASNNQFGNLLSGVKLNTEMVDWMAEDLSYLEGESYKRQYGQLLKDSKSVLTLQEALKAIKMENVRLAYKNFKEFAFLAKQVKIMDDEKAMIPRTAYMGVVETRPVDNNDGHHLLFLTPLVEQLRENFAAFA